MTWRVFVRADAEADFEGLDEPDRQSLAEELFSWIGDGPPRLTPRDVLGVEMFDDVIRSVFRVTYVLDDALENVLVVRIRQVGPAP